MYNIRQRAVVRPQVRDMIEINSQGAGVPLQRNWLDRWCTLPPDVKSIYDDIYNFEVFDDDLFVVTFPKCGTTWIQEAAWLLLNDLNFEQAKTVDAHKRGVFIEFCGLFNYVTENSVKRASQLPRPRLIKTHLPAHLIPQQVWAKKVKIIYCARNPKDVVCSFHPFHKSLGTWQGSLDEFVDDFINNDLMFSPYWPHTLDFWHMRDNPQIFFTTFERMKENLKAVLIDLNRFLGKPTLSAENLQKLKQHLSFENMKANDKSNPSTIISNHVRGLSKDFQFMRRGISGAFRDELSEENQKKLNEWTKESLKGEVVTESEIFGSM